MVSVDLPLPLTPVTQVKVPSGKAAVTFWQVVGGGAVDGDVLADALAAGGEERDLAAAGEVVGGEAVLAGEEVVERARRRRPRRRGRRRRGPCR